MSDEDRSTTWEERRKRYLRQLAQGGPPVLSREEEEEGEMGVDPSQGKRERRPSGTIFHCTGWGDR